jgi:hypothetical protein
MGSYILSVCLGLSLAAGLFIFVCVLTDSFASHHGSSYYDRHLWDVYDSKRAHEYKYGWCFLTASVACIFAEIVAVLCMTVHYRRCELMRDIIPIIDDKSAHSYFSSNESGCLIKTDDVSLKMDNKPQPDDSANGVLSETPPDICSTFLSAADQTDAAETLESIILPEKQLPVNEKFVHCPYNKNKKTCNFATLNTRNYRCLNYSAGTTAGKRYSTLGGCNAMVVDGPSSSSASSSSTFSHHAQYQHHQNAACIQNTLPRMKNCPANYNKYHAAERGVNVNAIEKLTDLSQPSCEDFKL